MQLIGIAIRWKTAFHPEGTLLFQGDVLESLPSLSLHRVAQGTYHLATGPLLQCRAPSPCTSPMGPGGGGTLATRTREPRFAHRHASIILYPPECLGRLSEKPHVRANRITINASLVSVSLS
jgi:hypothetical protein